MLQLCGFVSREEATLPIQIFRQMRILNVVPKWLSFQLRSWKLRTVQDPAKEESGWLHLTMSNKLYLFFFFFLSPHVFPAKGALGYEAAPFPQDWVYIHTG